MRIQHNIAAMNSYRNYNNNAAALNKNLEKLSSGYRINRAGDDAAGLAISEKMRAQIAGLDQAQANVKDGISLVKTAEGALQEVQDMMNRMVTLATQSANGTYQNEVDRENLQKEVTALKKEIDRIADSSNFNGQKLLNGELYAGTTVEIAGAASGTGSNAKSAVDVTLTADAYKKSADGEYDNLTFKLAATATASKVGAAINASGAVTITLKKGTAYTAADIKKLIADADTAAIDDLADGDAMKDALNSVTVSGEGVEKITTLAKSSGTPVDGSGTPLTLQIGDTAEDHNQLAVSVKDMHTKALGIDEIDISTLKGAQDAIQTIKDAINMVSSTRGDLGAIQNRLEHTQNNLSVMEENIQDAESTIRDTDIADEMTAYTKNNILLQSAQAMLAQANQMPQGVLQLLQ